ncbi:MAG: hypothetical protein QF717_13215 [SAR202 cluster bacterium]|nr:hypothetical protein [SAR202 cluster bacterium]
MESKPWFFYAQKWRRFGIAQNRQQRNKPDRAIRQSGCWNYGPTKTTLDDGELDSTPFNSMMQTIVLLVESPQVSIQYTSNFATLKPVHHERKVAEIFQQYFELSVGRLRHASLTAPADVPFAVQSDLSEHLR